MENLGDDLLRGARAAAAYCNLSPRTIYNLVEQGHVQVIRRGKILYFRKSLLDEAFKPEAA